MCTCTKNVVASTSSVTRTGILSWSALPLAASGASPPPLGAEAGL